MKERSKRKDQPGVPPGSSTVREAKLFVNGRSQAVRLPADCRFEGDSVYVRKLRGAVVLLPKENAWQPLLESLGSFSSDYMADRPSPGEQGRADLDSLFEPDP